MVMMITPFGCATARLAEIGPGVPSFVCSGHCRSPLQGPRTGRAASQHPRRAHPWPRIESAAPGIQALRSPKLSGTFFSGRAGLGRRPLGLLRVGRGPQSAGRSVSRCRGLALADSPRLANDDQGLLPGPADLRGEMFMDARTGRPALQRSGRDWMRSDSAPASALTDGNKARGGRHHTQKLSLRPVGSADGRASAGAGAAWEGRGKLQSQSLARAAGQAHKGA